MNADEQYDIAIVGAGPAGSTLARQLGTTNIRVLLIDGGSERSKPCGGLLAPDAQKVLAGFDLALPKDVLVDPQIFSVKTIDVERDLVRYYQRFYMNVDRDRFDRWLAGLVPERVSRFSGRCLSAAREGRGFRLTVRGDSPEGEKTVRCRLLVGADGADSMVRRTFFGGKIQRYTAIQQWFVSDGQTNPFYSCIFDRETSESCSWSIHKDGYFIYGGCFAPQHARGQFERQKARLEGRFGFAFSEPVKTEACLVCRPRRPRDFRLEKDGVFLAGEAAGLISPSSFEGISSAILSGKALGRAFSAGGSERRIAAAYRRATLPLRLKLLFKCFKRLFMYSPLLRFFVMKSGLTSIRVEQRGGEAAENEVSPNGAASGSTAVES